MWLAGTATPPARPAVIYSSGAKRLSGFQRAEAEWAVPRRRIACLTSAPDPPAHSGVATLT